MKKLLFSAVIISLLMLCGCTQNAPSPQNELISSNWTASLDGGGELSLKFYGEPGDLSAEFNLKNAGKDVTISGDCLVDSTSIVIFDSSVSQNYAFVLVALALALVRAALLPARALRRTAAVAGVAAALTFVVMLPATLLGQAHSAVLLGTKALVTTAIAMEVTLGTPVGALTRALRTLRVPATAVLTLDLALRSIVDLGCVAEEVLCALRLRSVGRDHDKRSSIGGVGGVLLLKAGRSAAETADAMACRGFDGSYDVAPERRRPHQRAVDCAWLLGTAALLALFIYLQGLV